MIRHIRFSSILKGWWLTTSKKAKTPKIAKTSRTAIAAIILIALLVVMIAIYVSTPFVQPLNINGLNGEAGVVKADGTVIPFQTGQSLYSSVQVNGVYLNLNDWLYWRFWLVLKSSGNIQNPSLTAVHFKLWQTGINEAYIAGTEGVAVGMLTTSPTESWFQVALPVDTAVTVPIKYRDNWLGDGAVDNATNPAPYTEVVGGQAVRSARVEKAADFASWAAGTYTWTLYCDVISVSWTYTVPGQGVQTQTFQPTPWRIYYTFTIVVGASGSLSVTLSGAGSQ